MNFGTRRCLLCVCHNDTLDIFALGLLCCTLHSLRGVFKMNMEVAIKSWSSLQVCTQVYTNQVSSRIGI